MGCGCGNTQTSAATSGGQLVAVPEQYQTVPTRADVEARAFSDRGDAELYLAANGGGHVQTVAAAA